MENDKIIARNFFAINDFSKSESGNYKVSGLLSIFDNEVENINGYVYHKGCYNNFCQNYYAANNKNIPLDILHNTSDIYHLAGKVTEFTATCPICSGVIELANGKPDQKQPLVGRCREAPHAHVYSFDRVLMSGKLLSR